MVVSLIVLLIQNILFLNSPSSANVGTQSSFTKESRFEAAYDLLLSGDSEAEQEGESRLYGVVKIYIERIIPKSTPTDEQVEILQDVTAEVVDGIKEGQIQDDDQLYKFSRSLVVAEYGPQDPPLYNKRQGEFEEQFIRIRNNIADSNLQIAQDGYTELFNLVKRQIYALLRPIPADQQDDLIQKVVMRVFTAMQRNRVESSSHLFHYSRLIARGEVSRYLLPVTYKGQMEKGAVDVESLLYFLHQKRGDAPLIVAQQKELIEKALQSLTSRQREVVSLYFLEERSVVEIAQHLGTSLSNIATILQRSIKTMRDKMIELGLIDNSENTSALQMKAKKESSVGVAVGVEQPLALQTALDLNEWAETHDRLPERLSPEEGPLYSKYITYRKTYLFQRNISSKFKALEENKENAYLREVEKNYSEFIEEMGYRPRPKRKGGKTQREINLFNQLERARLNPQFGKGVTDKAKKVLEDLDTAGARRTYTEINENVMKYHALPPSGGITMRRFKKTYANDPLFKVGLTDEAQALLYNKDQAKIARGQMAFVKGLNEYVKNNDKLPLSESKIMRNYRARYKNDEFVRSQLSAEANDKLNQRAAKNTECASSLELISMGN